MPTTIGFIGRGEVRPRNVKALLSDLVDAHQGNARFIIPFTLDHWSDGLDIVADWAINNDVPFEAITDETTDDLEKDAKALLKEASGSQYAKVVPRALVTALAGEATPQLIVLWEDTDVDAGDAIERAAVENIPAFDLTSGLDEIRLEPEAAEETDEPQPEGQDPDAEEADEPYTEEELEALDLDEPGGLKEICEANGIPIKPRSRKPTYIKAILDFQDGKLVPEGDPESGVEEYAARVAEGLESKAATVEHVVPEEADQNGDDAEVPEEVEDEEAVRDLADLGAVEELYEAPAEANGPWDGRGSVVNVAPGAVVNINIDATTIDPARLAEILRVIQDYPNPVIL
jgi:hypothetical protein